MRALVVFLAFLFSAEAPAQTQARRVALVIGVSAYEQVTVLTNPAPDAQRVHDALAATGFTLPPPLLNPTKADLDRALLEFSARAERADVAVLYFAGHGMQQFNDNWIIPKDAQLTRPANIRAEGVRLQDIVGYMQGATLRIIVLDACRNNPFSARWEGTMTPAEGLTRIEDAAVPQGTVIAYSAGPRQVAPDNGAYARAFAARVQEQGIELRQVFDRVREDTARGAELAPEVTVALGTAPFYFVGAPPAPDAGTVAGSVAISSRIEDLARNRMTAASYDFLVAETARSAAHFRAHTIFSQVESESGRPAMGQLPRDGCGISWLPENARDVTTESYTEQVVHLTPLFAELNIVRESSRCLSVDEPEDSIIVTGRRTTSPVGFRVLEPFILLGANEGGEGPLELSGRLELDPNAASARSIQLRYAEGGLAFADTTCREARRWRPREWNAEFAFHVLMFRCEPTRGSAPATVPTDEVFYFVPELMMRAPFVAESTARLTNSSDDFAAGRFISTPSEVEVERDGSDILISYMLTKTGTHSAAPEEDYITIDRVRMRIALR